jgi:hypothetical protein
MFDFFIAEIIETLMINIAWRNIEYVINEWIYPDDPLMNIYVSLAMGYGIYVILIACQRCIYKKASKFRLIPRLIVADICYILMFMSVIILWRVYYIVPATYVYNEHFKLEIYIISHFLSFLAAAILHASSVINGTTFNIKDGKVNMHGSYFLMQYFTELE